MEYAITVIRDIEFDIIIIKVKLITTMAKRFKEPFKSIKNFDYCHFLPYKTV